MTIRHRRSDSARSHDPIRNLDDDCDGGARDSVVRQRFLDMGAEHVDGNKVIPDDVGLTLLKFGTAASLIHIRMDFIPEILRAAEDLD